MRTIVFTQLKINLSTGKSQGTYETGEKQEQGLGEITGIH